MATFSVAFVDLDGRLQLTTTEGNDVMCVASRFLFATFPESEGEIAQLKTFDEVTAWCGRADVQLAVQQVT
jgi:hypothetical protein